MTTRQKNILFIMFDQLRFDYLSCAGHATLKTPHIDSIAARGVRFTNAYVQSPICGASRMSTYTGRYVSSHGAQWNGMPIRVGEMTMGDHLRSNQMACWLIGKTHMEVDKVGMERLGLSPDSIIGARQAECGFDVWCRDDGLWGEGTAGKYDIRPSAYNDYLKRQGYANENPWADFANAGIENGQTVSGWFMENADKPANIREEDSETPWLTTEAIKFIEQAETPWCAHVSYIKPHWPYIVPAPYHNLYGDEDIQAINRHQRELQSSNPVYLSFLNSQVSRAFHDEDVRNKVIRAYMGLIKQCDDQMGRLFGYVETSGRMKDTVIVITSDHGDYLGDHWMGDKDLFHEASVKVPLIIYDPDASADSTRGTTCDELVESIDLLATFIEMSGGTVPDHIVEGRSLVPFLNGKSPMQWREFAVSEYDYSMLPAAEELGLEPRDARLFMVADKRWKFMHAEGGFPPMLFDLESDPDEQNDLGSLPEFSSIVTLMQERLASWGLRMSQRVTRSDEWVKGGRDPVEKGILVGIVSPDEVSEAAASIYNKPAPQDYT